MELRYPFRAPDPREKDRPVRMAILMVTWFTVSTLAIIGALLVPKFLPLVSPFAPISVVFLCVVVTGILAARRPWQPPEREHALVFTQHHVRLEEPGTTRQFLYDDLRGVWCEAGQLSLILEDQTVRVGEGVVIEDAYAIAQRLRARIPADDAEVHAVDAGKRALRTLSERTKGKA